MDVTLAGYYPAARDNLISMFYFSLLAMIMPLRVVTFSAHNYLTRRDYSYSIDDICDLVVFVCLFVWIYTYFDWKDIVDDDRFAHTPEDRYTW